MDLRQIRLRNADQLTDHLRRERGGDVVHELDLALFGGLRHDLAADRANLRFHLRNDPSLEFTDEGPSIFRVTRRVHRQQHVAHHLETLRFEVLEDNPSL